MSAGRQPLALGDPGRGVSAAARRSRAVGGLGAHGVTRDSTRRLAAPDEGLLEAAWLAGTDAPADVFEQVLELAIEIAREGREGRRIGTMFTVGDHQRVLERSRCLILDPIAGHPVTPRRLIDPDVRETIKELAQLDGGRSTDPEITRFLLNEHRPMGG